MNTAANSMTAAHRLPGVLMRRCRGARAVASFNAAERHGATNQIQRIPVGQLSGRANAAHGFCLAVGSAASFNFNAADARSRATHLRAGWSPSAETHPCKSQMQKHGPEMPARRSSARPAALFNAVSNERSPEPGRCLVSSEAPGCRGDAYTQPSPCEMTTHCMAKANAGVGGRHGCTQHSDPQRFAYGLCRLPRPFSSLHPREYCGFENVHLWPVDHVTDIPRPYALPPGPVQIAFSGGRSSAYMLHEILRENGPLPNRVVVSFQNTGREMPETLDFVREVGERWSVPIVWVEYRSESPRFAVVDHATASRDGEPFEQLIRKRAFLPNQQARFCTTELKVLAAKRYLVSLGWDYWTTATGLRADEVHRFIRRKIFDRMFNWCPMVAAGVGKSDVAEFWRRQPFDLRLPNINGKTPLGNCDGCFLKAEAIQAHLAVHYPERHSWWERMESIAGGTFSKRFAKRDLREFMERQGDMLSVEGALCQRDDGECFA